MSKSAECIDHLGNVFPNTKAMCDYHNVLTTTYYRRRNNGKTLEEALSSNRLAHKTSTPKEMRTDHLGNVFTSERAMCKSWNVPFRSYLDRIRKGCTVEEALLGKHIVRDHLGAAHKNLQSMCKAWNITYFIYQSRKQSGWSLEDILTVPIQRATNSYNGWKVLGLVYIDPKGEKFYLCRKDSDEEVMTKAELDQAI